MAQTNDDPVAVVQDMQAGIRKENHQAKLLTLASSGRHVIFSFPRDLTDDELLDYLGWLLHGFRAGLPQSSPGRVALKASQFGPFRG